MSINFCESTKREFFPSINFLEWAKKVHSFCVFKGIISVFVTSMDSGRIKIENIVIKYDRFRPFICKTKIHWENLKKFENLEKFCEHNLSRIDQYRIFRVLDQNSRKFLLLKYVMPEFISQLCSQIFLTEETLRIKD